VASKQVIMMHPDSSWAGSQLAMAVQPIKRGVGLVLTVIGLIFWPQIKTIINNDIKSNCLLIKAANTYDLT